MGRWKGIRLGAGKAMELYDLTTDVGETRDVARKHPDVVGQIEEIMITAVTPESPLPGGRDLREREVAYCRVKVAG